MAGTLVSLRVHTLIKRKQYKLCNIALPAITFTKSFQLRVQILYIIFINALFAKFRIRKQEIFTSCERLDFTLGSHVRAQSGHMSLVWIKLQAMTVVSAGILIHVQLETDRGSWHVCGKLSMGCIQKSTSSLTMGDVGGERACIRYACESIRLTVGENKLSRWEKYYPEAQKELFDGVKENAQEIVSNVLISLATQGLSHSGVVAIMIILNGTKRTIHISRYEILPWFN